MLRGCFHKRGWMFECDSPLLDLSEVVSHMCARSNIELEVVNERLNVLEGLENVEVLKIGKGILKIYEKRRGAGVAGLHLSKVVLTNHTVDETGEEIGNGHQIELIVAAGLGNGADSDIKDVSSSLARLIVLSGIPICLHG